MNISITFRELQNYIKNHYGKVVNFSKVSDKTVRISYSQKVLFKTVDIPLNISIDNVEPASLLLSYNSGFGIDIIIDGVLAFVKGKLPELNDVIKSGDNHQLSIELSKLSNLKSVFEKVELTGISIINEGIVVSVALL